MRASPRLRSIALLLGAAFFGCRESPARKPTVLMTGSFARANLLLITIDTLRADRLGSYGSARGLSPFLDRLAAEGVRFAEASAHVPLTLPSHSSIFTGRLPSSHGVHDNGTFHLDPSHPTLATALRSAGYRTGAFVGAFVLDARFGLDRGFDVYDDYYGEKRAFESFVELERRAEQVLPPAERWIETDDGRPWFAWVHLFDPHAPYEAPEAFRARHRSDPYGAEVAYVDAALGDFIGRLDEKDLLADTLVVLTADHGESLDEHGERTHGTFAYQSTLRVPWILWAASRISPGVFPSRVSHVDLMPTLLDLLGVESATPTDGRSLAPYLRGERIHEETPIYFEALNPHLTRDWAPLRGVVDGGVKLIDLPIPELYDLNADPGETRNLHGERAALARSLTERLEGFASDVISGGEAPDAETLRRLESLGYVVGPAASRKSTYGPSDDPKKLIAISNAHDDASELFRQGRIDDALNLLRDLLARQPRSSFAYQRLAYGLHQAGRLGEAVQTLETALLQGVNELSLLALLGSYLLEAGRVGEARTLLEDLVRRYPDFAEGHNYLGVAYARLGRADAAEKEFRAVLALDPSSAATHNNLGSLALSRRQLEQAVAHFEKALSFDADHAGAHNGLGVVRAQQGDMEAAIASWSRAVELDPTQFDALFNLSMALWERSPERAADYLERFVRTAPPERYGADIETARRLLGRP